MAFIKHDLIKKDTVEARLYQELIVTKIIEKGNSLVVAPTALGKTIVAVMLAAHKLKENKENKILFLAPTKPLAVQHEKSFKKFLEVDDDQIVSITGTTKPSEREKIYDSATIINATPQTIENDLLNGRLNLKKFALVIFDEAHRAIGDYAYVFVNLQLQKHNRNALVVALTASPGSNEEKIQDVCRNLSIKNIEIKNNEDEDVKPYVNEIEIDWVRVELPTEFQKIKLLLETFQRVQLKFLKSIHIAKTENKNYYNRIRLLEMQAMLRKRLSSGNANPILFSAISKSAAMLKVAHAIELLDTQGIGALNNYWEKVLEEGARGKSKAAKNIIANEDVKQAIRETRDLFEKNIQHPKYAELKKIILEQFKAKPKSKIIVFNHYRDSIKEVVNFLKDEKKIKATRFIGQATKGTEKGMSQKIQQQVLDELREGKHNVLVASSVAEEGLDIPSVELVVFFEPVPSEIRTIQRRGRTGRFGKGKTIILMAKGTRDEAFYWTAKNKEKKMKTTLNRIKGTPLPEQSTLLNFSENEAEERIIVFVDSREQASNVTKKLFDRDAKVIMKQLTVGDYVLSKDVCVERKSVEDFLASMIDGRLFNQLVDLRENYSKPLVILEGNIDELFTLRNMHRNAIIGALTSIALDYQIPIINTKNVDETAEYLYLIAKREQFGKDRDIRLRIGRKGLSVSEQQRYIVEGFPLVGPLLARNLLKEFGSVKGIIDADEKDLQNVENLGKVKAKKIKKILEAKFKEEKDKEAGLNLPRKDD
ncbi:MAG: DEAD/DEAH box helicase [Candidatus Diapherotrites archaeon]|jgi:ERCC4-related helicase|nr:DEAD/DEAH box helicase [Candidatus Diapherotrites archaeon]MBT4597015.1 DEAD/DEAH box helicase [Candidatus Diapherotrites archaeon]